MTGYCPNCGELININYFLIYFKFNAYFVAICPVCNEVAREKFVKEPKEGE